MALALARMALHRGARSPWAWAGLVLWWLGWRLLAAGGPVEIWVIDPLKQAASYEVVLWSSTLIGLVASSWLRPYERATARVPSRTLMLALGCTAGPAWALLVVAAAQAQGGTPWPGAVLGAIGLLPALLPLGVSALMLGLRLAAGTQAFGVVAGAVLLTLARASSPSGESAPWWSVVLPILGLGIAALPALRSSPAPR